MSRLPLFVSIYGLALILFSCSGVDRAGEKPELPVVETMEATLIGEGVCNIQGQVTKSSNSSITACGFVYGNDSISEKIKLDKTEWSFNATIESLESGRYFYAAYATNGMGTAYGDTLYFTIP